MQPSYWRAKRIIRSLLAGDADAKKRVDFRSMTEKPLVQFVAFRIAHAELSRALRELCDTELSPLEAGTKAISEQAVTAGTAALDCERLLRAAHVLHVGSSPRVALVTSAAAADFARRAYALHGLILKQSASLDHF
jgi:hypothetical protein